MLSEEGVRYGSRKIASYAQALAYFLLVEKEVEDSGSIRCQQLWIQAFGSKRIFLESYIQELRKTDIEIEKMMDQSRCLSGCPTCACGEGRLNMTEAENVQEVPWENVEEIVSSIIEKAALQDMADVKKVVTVHNETSGVQNLSLSHTNAKKSFLQKTWAELGLPKKHEKIIGPKKKTFVKKNSNVREGDGGCKGVNTVSTYCYQIDVQVVY